MTYKCSCVASLPFINSLLWPHGIVKCPSYVHFRITPGRRRSSEYFAYSFTCTVNLDILFLYFSHIFFFVYYIVGKCVIVCGCSHCVIPQCFLSSLSHIFFPCMLRVVIFSLIMFSGVSWLLPSFKSLK